VVSSLLLKAACACRISAVAAVTVATGGATVGSPAASQIFPQGTSS